MLATVDLQGVQTRSADPELLQAYLQQLVGQPFADLGPADDLLEFLVEPFIAAAPIDVGLDRREKEGEEQPKIPLKGVLPRRIEIGMRFKF